MGTRRRLPPTVPPARAPRAPLLTLLPAASPAHRPSARPRHLAGVQPRPTTPTTPRNTVSARNAMRAAPRTRLCAPKPSGSVARSLPPRVTAPPPVAVPIRSTTRRRLPPTVPPARAPRAPLLTLLPAASPAHRPSARPRHLAGVQAMPTTPTTPRNTVSARNAMRAAPRTRLCAPRGHAPPSSRSPLAPAALVAVGFTTPRRPKLHVPLPHAAPLLLLMLLPAASQATQPSAPLGQPCGPQVARPTISMMLTITASVPHARPPILATLAHVPRLSARVRRSARPPQLRPWHARRPRCTTRRRPPPTAPVLRAHLLPTPPLAARRVLPPPPRPRPLPMEPSPSSRSSPCPAPRPPTPVM